MDARAHFTTLARDNVWATRTLSEHVDAMPEFDHRRDFGLFFESLHGTLNHLPVAERVAWSPRFAEGISSEIALNAELEADRARLRERLQDAAPRWLPLVASMDVARFDAMLDDTTTRGVAQSLPFAPTLGHVFNHGTHHSGQISAAITAMGHRCLEVDLISMLQAESASPRTEEITR